MSDLISIIVPVYKVENYLLKKCLDSILCQTYTNIEVLIVDDGSPDNCGIICDDYAKHDSRIRVFHTENKGVSCARNLALKEAKGQYIYFVDSDDYIENYAIEKLISVMQKESCDCVMSSVSHIRKGYADGNLSKQVVSKLRRYSQKQAIEAMCYLEQPFEEYEMGAIWATLYKRGCIGDILFNTEMKIGEDFEFKYKVFLKAKAIVCISDKLYNYYIREDSAMRNGFDVKKVDSVTELIQLMKSHYAVPQYKEALLSKVCNIAIVVLFMIPVKKEFEEYRRPIKEFLYNNRKKVICNSRNRKKVRLSLLLSYIGLDFVQKLFFAARS
jgi:glycosyltransferase involved in cell wall biosynthesis